MAAIPKWHVTDQHRSMGQSHGGRYEMGWSVGWATDDGRLTGDVWLTESEHSHVDTARRIINEAVFRAETVAGLTGGGSDA